MVAIYVRQSLDQKDSISIETQIDFCKKEITDNAEYKVFQDKGFSGKNIVRPAFTKLLKEIEGNKVSKVIVYRLDRISRSITDFANIIDILEENKVDFISANEKFDTSTPVGRAMLYIIMVFAQLERETIAERIRDNYYARGKTGVWLGGPAPLGFDNKKTLLNGKKISQLEPNSHIQLIKRIYTLYADSNISLGGIAKILKAEQGTMWNNIKLSRILHNPAYVKADADIYTFFKSKKCTIVSDVKDFNGEKGCSLYGKRDRGANKYRLTSGHVLSVAMHEGIIDSKTWLRCQTKLESNKQIKNTGKGKHTWLTGLVKCGYCGYAMNVKVYNEFKYFCCTGRYSTDLCRDKLKTHHVKDIEDCILPDLQNFIESFHDLTLTRSSQENDPLINKLKIELLKVETEIDNLLKAVASANNVLIGYINARITELDTTKHSLLRQLNDKNVESPPMALPKIDNWISLDPESKKDIVNGLISKVLVYNDKVEVVWKY